MPSSKPSEKAWTQRLTDFLPRALGSEGDDPLQHLQRVSAGETAIMMLSALGIGLVCGLLAIGLNASVHAVRGALGGSEWGPWVILFPAAGMGLAVYLIRSLMKDFAGHGVSDVIQGMTAGTKSLRRRMIASRFVGSLLTVGSGGSTGLEGPIVCVGGAWGTLIGRWLDMNERRKRLLIGYGVAGAVAGIFNAPLTGLIFTLEIIVGEYTALTILPTIIAAVSATEVSRLLAGNKITFHHEIANFSPTSLVACIALGVLTGLLSVVFVRSLPWWESVFARLTERLWIRAATGGLLVGLLGYWFPEILAEGYVTTQAFLTAEVRPTLLFVLGFVLLKLVACGVTLGSGGVGGVFAPSLVIGSGVGLAFGMGLQLLPLEGIAEETAFALTGMTGMVTGVMHGPLTGIFLVMEATRGYSLILPLMLTASSAMVVSSYFESGSVYTRELIARGHLMRRGTDRYLLHTLNIRDILDRDFDILRDTMLLGEFVEVFKHAHRNYFPVVNKEQQCVGVVFLDDVRSYLFDSQLYPLVTMGTIMRNLPNIDLQEPTDEALEKFETSQVWSLPVVENGRFLGMLSKSTLFDHYRRELQIQEI